MRLHPDEVDGLGTFLEFEAVLGLEIGDDEGHAQLSLLRQQFSILDADLLAVSYSDLVAKT